jgi:uncharacterized protein YybS (DUF2232 family)
VGNLGGAMRGPGEWRRRTGLGVEILLAALLAVGLFASGAVFPLLGVALSLLSPLPLVVLGLRHGRGPLLVALLLAAAALAGPLTGLHALIFGVEFGAPALLLAEGIRRGRRPEAIVIGVALLLALGGWLVLTVSAGNWVRPQVAVERHVDALLADMENLTGRMGLPSEGEAGADVSVRWLRPLLLAGFPGFFFVGSLLSAAGYVLLLQGLLRRWSAQLGAVAAAPFRWELPELLVWAVIGSGGLFISGVEPWRTLGINGLIGLVGLYFLQGLSIAAFLFRRFQLPRFLATLSVALLVFQPVFTLVVAGLGLFDVWFAFRRLTLPRAPEES